MRVWPSRREKLEFSLYWATRFATVGLLAYVWFRPPEALLWFIVLRYSGRSLDLLLFVIGGILTAFMAVLAGHLATPDNAIRRWFYASGAALAVVIVITGWRGYVNAGEQEERLKQLSARIDVISQKSQLWISVMPTKLPDATGHVTVPFEIGNRSTVNPGDVSVFASLDTSWCHFDKNNPGWQRNTIGSTTVVLPVVEKGNPIQPGTHTNIFTLRLVVPPYLSPCTVYFYYSCQQCRPESTDRRNWLPVYFPPYLDFTP